MENEQDILTYCINNVFNFEMKCISFFLSKGLSIILIFFSLISKLSQILSMYRDKNIKSLNSISIFSNVLTFIFASTYCFHMKYPVLSYGECIIILIQNITIFILFWKYQKEKYSNIKNLIFTILIILFLIIALKLDIINEKIWIKIYSSTFTLTSISKISQLYSSYKAKSTGPLSAFNFIFGMGSSLIRIFTSFKETGDLILILNYCYNFMLNFAVLSQIIYYNNFYNRNHEKMNMNKESETLKLK